MHPMKLLVRVDGLAEFFVQAAYPWQFSDNRRR